LDVSDCWLKKICAFPTDKKKRIAFYWNIFFSVLSLSQSMLTDIFLVEFLRPLQKKMKENNFYKGKLSS
jgi:hypothetical protein